MRHVILRDDDTNAATPLECLERLYRPFLDRGLPVNLATIPEVSMAARTPTGAPEEFLFNRNGASDRYLPIGANTTLVRYLRENSGYCIVQHGCHHDMAEFGALQRAEAVRLLDRGTEALLQAGFSRPCAFAAPHDKFSSASLSEVALRFPVLTTGWFEWSRIPYSWRAGYLMKKLRRARHWRRGRAQLLTHPGCLLSRDRPGQTMLNTIIEHLNGGRLTVLVTHWWEYYRNGEPDDSFIAILHEVADYLTRQKDIAVISFDQLATDSTICT